MSHLKLPMYIALVQARNCHSYLALYNLLHICVSDLEMRLGEKLLRPIGFLCELLYLGKNKRVAFFNSILVMSVVASMSSNVHKSSSITLLGHYFGLQFQ